MSHSGRHTALRVIEKYPIGTWIITECTFKYFCCHPVVLLAGVGGQSGEKPSAEELADKMKDTVVSGPLDKDRLQLEAP